MSISIGARCVGIPREHAAPDVSWAYEGEQSAALALVLEGFDTGGQVIEAWRSADPIAILASGLAPQSASVSAPWSAVARWMDARSSSATSNGRS